MVGKCLLQRAYTEEWKTFTAYILIWINLIFNGSVCTVFCSPSCLNVCIPDFTGGMLTLLPKRFNNFEFHLQKLTVFAFTVPH